MAKQVSDIEMIIDFFTKLKNVFKDDFYIKDGNKIFSGKNTNNSIFGDIYVEIPPEYLVRLKCILDLSKELWYVPSVTEFKTILKNMSDNNEDISTFDREKCNIIWFHSNTDEYRRLSKIEDRIINHHKDHTGWKNISAVPEDILNTLFDDSKAAKFKEGDFPFVTISKRLFPMLTIKKLESVYYNIRVENADQNLYSLSSVSSFPTMTIYSVYYFIGIED